MRRSRADAQSSDLNREETDVSTVAAREAMTIQEKSQPAVTANIRTPLRCRTAGGGCSGGGDTTLAGQDEIGNVSIAGTARSWALGSLAWGTSRILDIGYSCSKEMRRKRSRGTKVAHKSLVVFLFHGVVPSSQCDDRLTMW